MDIYNYLIFNDDFLGSAIHLSKADACGTEKTGKIVPDYYGKIPIFPACKIHDFDYTIGKIVKDKIKADLNFLGNLLIILSGKDEDKISKEKYIILVNNFIAGFWDWYKFENELKKLYFKSKLNWFKKMIRYSFARKYYNAVRIFGNSAFWENK